MIDLLNQNKEYDSKRKIKPKYVINITSYIWKMPVDPS